MGLSERIYNMFNGEGRLLQLEYGLEALYSSYQIVSIISNAEIVFISKKVPQQPLQEEAHNSIYEIGKGLYINITGLPADVDYVLDRCRTLAASTEYQMGCKVTPDVFSTLLAEKLQERIQKTAKRAPAFAMTIGGFENDKPMLYYTDMSAVQYPCFASAAGEDHSKMIKHLEKHYKPGDREFAIQLGVAALLQSIGGEAESTEVQVAILTNNGIEYANEKKINDVIQSIAESG